MKKDTCQILHDAVTPLTTLLVSEIKMAALTITFCLARLSLMVNHLKQP